ncbi:IclR family transcriptional regulator [Tsukamurella sp. NPDC003166]|uniref:IclR family transcriptional regulator n=1 Tax=Tsukamurella sp. NPDC003166 TaxID=3154444 RepID=UPI0033B9A009
MSEPGESMISRVVRVLEACKTAPGPLTATDLARRTGIPVPSTHRIVGELVDLRLLARDADRRVRIGDRLWEIAERARPDVQRVRAVTRPHLEQLSATVGAAALLSVLDGDDVLNVDTVHPRAAAALNITHPGVRLPALASSPGLLLVAMGPPRVRQRILRSARLVRFTQHTVVDTESLGRILDEAARRGHATVSEWITVGSVGTAVPVHDDAGRVIAAVSVTTASAGPPVSALLPPLHAAASAIGLSLSTMTATADPRVEYLLRQVQYATGTTD